MFEQEMGDLFIPDDPAQGEKKKGVCIAQRVVADDRLNGLPFAGAVLIRFHRYTAKRKFPGKIPVEEGNTFLSAHIRWEELV